MEEKAAPEAHCRAREDPMIRQQHIAHADVLLSKKTPR